MLIEKDSSVIFQLQLATALTFQAERDKQREAYDIFSRLRSRTSNKEQLDSMISRLEKELGLK
jgi:hypothetical protein